jgi:hypothetical protein
MNTSVIKRKTKVIEDEDEESVENVTTKEEKNIPASAGKNLNGSAKKSQTSNLVRNGNNISHSNSGNGTSKKPEKIESSASGTGTGTGAKSSMSIEERIKMLKKEKELSNEAKTQVKNISKPVVNGDKKGVNQISQLNKVKPLVKKIQEINKAPVKKEVIIYHIFIYQIINLCLFLLLDVK